VLANYKTASSYTALKELLMRHTPVKRSANSLSYRVTDSMQLARTLFPDILKLSNNTFFAERIIEVCAEMLDSNEVNLAMLTPYKNNFLHTADTILHNLKSEEDIYGYAYTDLLHLLSRFNDEECNGMLERYLALDNLVIKQEAVLALLKNGKAVDPAHLKKLAAANHSRSDFYRKLKKIGKDDLFPAKFRTQRYIAESEIFTNSSEDDEPASIKFLSEKLVFFKGTKQKFYLFEITFHYGEDAESSEHYLGIAGPFSTDKKQLETSSSATGLFYEKPFDKEAIDKQFATYLESLESEEEND